MKKILLIGLISFSGSSFGAHSEKFVLEESGFKCTECGFHCNQKANVVQHAMRRHQASRQEAQNFVIDIKSDALCVVCRKKAMPEPFNSCCACYVSYVMSLDVPEHLLQPYLMELQFPVERTLFSIKVAQSFNPYSSPLTAAAGFVPGVRYPASAFAGPASEASAAPLSVSVATASDNTFRGPTPNFFLKK